MMNHYIQKMILGEVYYYIKTGLLLFSVVLLYAYKNDWAL